MRLFRLIAVFVFAPLGPVFCQARSAQEILREFDGIAFPGNSIGSTAEEFRKKVERVARKKGELAIELYEGHPEHPRAGELLGARWTLAINSLQQPATVLAEAEAKLAIDDLRAGVRREALLARARALLKTGAGAGECLLATEAFLEVDADDTAGGFLIMDLLYSRDIPPEVGKTLVGLVADEWPDDKWLKAYASGYAAQLAKIGKPLPLAFTDLLTGDEVRSDDGASRHTLCVYWSSKLPDDAAGITAAAAARDDLRVLGVVTFRMQGGADAVVEMLGGAGITWPHCYDEARIGNPFETPYKTPRTPFYYLLDADGNVLRFAYEWSVVKQILGRLPAGNG
jgi:hypothetical protein